MKYFVIQAEITLNNQQFTKYLLSIHYVPDTLLRHWGSNT